ncbi:MAG: hypothetical protein R3B96_25235, partial [Pirellulaceae bacterium]
SATLENGAITEIRVGNAPEGEGVLVVDSWRQAIETVERNRSIQEIQLWFDGVRDIQPFVVTSPALRIVAGPGHRPRVRFTTLRDNSSTAPIVRLFGGEFEWRGVDIDWRIENDASVLPGSLFRIEQNYLATFPNLIDPPSQNFDFVETRVTVASTATSVESPSTARTNATGGAATGTPASSASGSPSSNGSGVGVSTTPSASWNLENGPAMIEVVRPESFFLALPNADGIQFPRMLVRRVLLRGNCRLIKASPGTPFSVKWQQSLFASPLAAIRLGGIRRDASASAEALKARIEMEQVTTVGSSLVDIQPAEASPIVMPMDLQTNGCWFIAANPQALLRYRLTRPIDYSGYLQWSGDENVLAGDAVLWSSSLMGGPPSQLETSDSLTQTPLAELRKPEVVEALPEALSRFLSGEAGMERLEPSDIKSAIGQLPSGVSRRLGVTPEDLPAPYAETESP